MWWFTVSPWMVPAFQVLARAFWNRPTETSPLARHGTYSLRTSLLFNDKEICTVGSVTTVSFLFFTFVVLIQGVFLLETVLCESIDWISIHVWELKCFIQSNISLWHIVTICFWKVKISVFLYISALTKTCHCQYFTGSSLQGCALVTSFLSDFVL